MSPGPPLANSSEAPERSHSRAPSASLQRLWDASLMRSRLAFKKVGPEDWGLRQKASRVRPRRARGNWQADHPLSAVHRNPSCTSTTSRAYRLIRVELRLTREASFGRCRAETGAVWVGHGAASAVPAGDNIRYAPQGASGLRLREAHATCQGFGLAVILEVAVSECVDAFALYCAPLSSASAKRSSSP